MRAGWGALSFILDSAAPHPRPLPATRFASGGRGENIVNASEVIAMTLEVIDVIAVDVLAYRSLPRAATGSVPTISSPRTITTSSTMLTTTQT